MRDQIRAFLSRHCDLAPVRLELLSFGGCQLRSFAQARFLASLDSSFDVRILGSNECDVFFNEAGFVTWSAT
jgi:hypothetical protein